MKIADGRASAAGAQHPDKVLQKQVGRLASLDREVVLNFGPLLAAEDHALVGAQAPQPHERDRGEDQGDERAAGRSQGDDARRRGQVAIHGGEE